MMRYAVEGIDSGVFVLPMNDATYKILKVTLSADNTISPDQRDAALAVLNGRVLKNASLPLVLTQKQAADLLGISRFTIRKMTMEGQLHPVRIHESWRYRREELEALVSGQLS